MVGPESLKKIIIIIITLRKSGEIWGKNLKTTEILRHEVKSASSAHNESL